MNFINVSQVKKYVKENNKQISKEALIILDRKVLNILDSAISLTRGFKRITDTEISYSKGE